MLQSCRPCEAHLGESGNTGSRDSTLGDNVENYCVTMCVCVSVCAYFVSMIYIYIYIPVYCREKPSPILPDRAV